MSWQGKITRSRLRVHHERLEALLTVRGPRGDRRTVLLSDRELAALLPRRLFLGQAEQAPRALVPTLAAVIADRTLNRWVLVETDKVTRRARFLSWASVRFPPAEHAVPGLHDDSKGHGDVQRALGAGHGN
jgi:hypothetical protein